MAINEEKRKAYDNKHGINAYHHRFTKAGRAQSKAYDKYFVGKSDSKSKALKAKKGQSKKHKKLPDYIGPSKGQHYDSTMINDEGN